MIYTELEDEIVSVLQPLGTNLIEVKHYPETEEELKYKQALIAVAFAGSDFGKPQSTSLVSQEEKLQYNVTIRSKGRRGDRSVYGLMAAVKAKLLGYRSIKYGHSRFYLVSNNFTMFDKNEWGFTLVFALDTTITQEVPPENNPPLSGTSFHVSAQ